jgi:hypothetical protein
MFPIAKLKKIGLTLHLFLQINKFHSCSYLFSPDIPAVNTSSSLLNKKEEKPSELDQASHKEKRIRDYNELTNLHDNIISDTENLCKRQLDETEN